MAEWTDREECLQQTAHYIDEIRARWRLESPDECPLKYTACSRISRTFIHEKRARMAHTLTGNTHAHFALFMLLLHSKRYSRRPGGGGKLFIFTDAPFRAGRSNNYNTDTHAQTYMAVLVQLVICQLQFVERDDLFHPRGARRRRVGMQVNARRRDWVRFARHYPAGAAAGEH